MTAQELWHRGCVHESAHEIVARKLGVEVKEFHLSLTDGHLYGHIKHAPTTAAKDAAITAAGFVGEALKFGQSMDGDMGVDGPYLAQLPEDLLQIVCNCARDLLNLFKDEWSSRIDELVAQYKE